MKLPKEVHGVLFLFILLFCINSVAEEAAFDEESFFIKLSVDNNLTVSQNAATNIAFSAISSLAYLADRFDLNENLFYRLGLGYSAAMIYVLSHELSGHGLRALEFGGTITELSISPFSKFLIPKGSLGHSKLKNPHQQKETMISLGGMQTNYLLSQKIADHFVFRNQKIVPVTGAGYFFTILDQIGYNYLEPALPDESWRSAARCIDKAGTYRDSNDVRSYSVNMQEMYGDRSITTNTMKRHGFLSLLDPIFFASIYSFLFGKSVDVPILNIGNIGIIPFARSIFTPYGSIEKKFGSYILTNYTPIKVGFSIGKQFKTDKPRLNQAERACFYLIEDTSCNVVQDNDVFRCGNSDSSIGIFTSLKEGEVVEKHITYSFDISVFKLFNFGKLNIGASTVFWQQPELFVEDPYRAKPKNGFMFTLNSSYEISENLNILCDIGYKSKGFIPGQYVNETPIINLALERKI